MSCKAKCVAREGANPEYTAGKCYLTIGLAAMLLVVALGSVGCGAGKAGRAPWPEYSGPEVSPQQLALWFAPDLYLNSSEPFGVVAVIPVLHPSEPIIAYHVFFDDDAMLAGRGKQLDHEVMWVKYDPVTLKAVDVLTLWHRTVLETGACAPDARLRGQHARVCVQWGQHGLLPFGWESLVTVRPRLELLMHYELVRYINRIPRASRKRPPVAFQGTYQAYTSFTRELQTRAYVETTAVVVGDDSDDALRARLAESFMLKKQWPDW
jgi:hypothetical protein